MKRTLLFILAFLPMLASAQNAVEIDGIYYNLFIDNQAEVTWNPNEYKGDVVIPESVTYNGVVYNVTSIGDKAFIICFDLTSVTIPENVFSIGQEAFEDCYRLTSITIPESVTWIGEQAFSGCHSLTSVIIPKDVTSIEDGTFSNCSGLKSVIIPSNVQFIGKSAFYNCSGLKSVTIPEYITSIEDGVFEGCIGLTSVTIPDNVTSIGDRAFEGCSGLTSVTIPDNVTSIGGYAFAYCDHLINVIIGSGIESIGMDAFDLCPELMDVYCYAKNVPKTNSQVFRSHEIEKATLHVPAASVSAYQSTEPWKNFKEIVALPAQYDYRPFVEDGKVWKVGRCDSGNPVQFVEYFYFDGDTIIDGKTCKQMMCQRYVSPEYPDYAIVMQYPLLRYVGAWYEEDKKVYVYNTTDKQFKLMYDFSVDDNATLQIHGQSYVIGPKQPGGIKGFKGVYRDVMMPWDEEQSIYNTTWLEGVGGIEGPEFNVYLGEEYHGGAFLMSCTVGDEVIYLNDEYEDGATPEGARKRRFDFTHTIKTQPKSRMRNGTEVSMYGEYNDQQLCINLNPLDDTYQVRITDESGKPVYEKEINAGNIVGLNIDISSYAEGRYAVTVENSSESFTGEFGAQTTGIKEISNKKEEAGGNIYNLKGQRLNSLQRGLNIVNGQKIYVK